MKKLFLLSVVVFIAAPLFAGTVKDVKGDVDVLIGGKWQKASSGMDIGDNTKIMTGISSTIRIDNTTGHFIVKELSMVTYREKISDKEIDQKLSIDVGKVRVRFAKAKSIKSSFKVQTPKGTASVRGTEEEVGYYPLMGMSVEVILGLIELVDNNGNGSGMGQGENGGVGQNGELYGNSDLNEEFAGILDQFSDHDYENGALEDSLRDFFDHLFGALNEPERL